MKKLFLVPVTIFLVITFLVMGACAPSAPAAPTTQPATSAAPPPAKTIVINWTHFEPDVPAAFNDLHREFVKKISDKTQGRVKINIAWNSVLGQITEYARLVKEGGVAQGGTMPGTFTKADMPLWSAAGLPFFTSGIRVAPRAIFSLGKEWDIMQTEAKNMNMVIVGVSQMDPGTIISKDRISSLDDLKGKKMTALGYWAALLPKLGAAHVPLGGGETVDGLQKGLISGLFGNSYSTSKRLKQYEVCKYQYIIPLGGNTIDLYAINKGVWDQISSADQKAVLDVFEDVTVNFYPTAFDTEFNAIKDFYKSQGAVTEDLPAAEWAKLKQIGEEVVIADWLKQMKDRGLPGDEWINKYKAKVQQFSK